MEEVIPKVLDAKISTLTEDAIAAEAIESAHEDFRHRFIEISYSQMEQGMASAHIPVGEDTGVQEFMNEAWYSTGISAGDTLHAVPLN